MDKKHKILGFGLPIAIFLAIAVWYLHHTSIPVLEPAGPIAAQEKHLIVTAFLLMLIVVVPVFVFAFTFAYRYREGRGAKYQPNWDHSRLFETIWWLIPSVLILTLSIITWRSTHQLDPYKPIASSNKQLTIEVVALDWKWLFIYPEQHIATVNYVKFPKNTPLSFQITADAPMNSFWIPQLGGQIYAMPGMNSQMHLLASRSGSFYGSSANISGRGFAGMHFQAIATSQSNYNHWLQTMQHAPKQLTAASYNQLSRGSVNNPTANYTLKDDNLYTAIMLKYMEPGTERSITAQTQTNLMSNMTDMTMDMQP